MQKITPHLWYDKEAKKAAEFYVEIFKNNSKITSIQTLKNTPSGDTEVVTFALRGQEFIAISAGPDFKFNESISFVINCENQEEVDYFWEKLSSVPEAEICGWLKDKFGLSWQVVPVELNKMLSDKDQEKVNRVVQTFLKMKKIDLEELRRAYKSDA